MNDVRIVPPDDPSGAAFDEQGAPFIVFGDHAGDTGWTLWYLDDNGVPVDRFIGGQVDDAGWAVTQAGAWLRMGRS